MYFVKHLKVFSVAFDEVFAEKFSNEGPFSICCCFDAGISTGTNFQHTVTL